MIALRALALVMLVSSLTGCPGGSSGTGEPATGAQKRAGATWLCDNTTAGDGCSCRALKPDWHGSGGSVPHCVAYKCCLLNDAETESTLGQCECSDTIASCDAEAKARKNTSVVSQCPPEDEDHVATACAENGESCSQSYFDQNELTGCCSGMVCLQNDAGVRVCQKGSAKQLELATQCTKVASQSGTVTAFPTPPAEPLRTSVGDLEIGAVQFAFSTIGPAGCLTSIDMTLGSGCQLELRAETVDGKLVPTYLFATLDQCPGYTGADHGGTLLVSDPTVLASAFDFSFEGLACDGNLVFESYCVAGTFDWHFNGAVLDGVTFDDQHLSVQGVTCTPDEPAGQCPSK